MDIKTVKTSDKRVFRVALSGRHALSQKWDLRLREVLDASPDALAVFWDDVVGRRTGGHRYDPFRVIWPDQHPILLRQADLDAHCAVNQTEMKRMLGRGLIQSLDDISNAFITLSKSHPDKIIHADEILRHTRSTRSDAYAGNSHMPEPQNKASRISLIINYRDRPDLMEDCLRGISNQKVSGQIELILINNQSTEDNKAEIIEMTANMLPKHVDVVHFDYNKPFNKSVQDNMGVKKATGEVVIFFNNDAELLSEDCLQMLADWALEPGIACTGPRILGDSERMVSNGVFARKATETQPALIRENELEVFEFSVRPTVGISFACAAVSKAALDDIGPLDTKVFKSQYNDADFFIRALQKGYKHMQVGLVSCRHEPGASEARTKEKTFALLAQFVKRYPSIGDYAGVDFDAVKLKSIPKFDDPVASKHMKKIRNWRKIRGKLIQSKSRVRSIAKKIMGKGI